jgi:hypothetical protein
MFYYLLSLQRTILLRSHSDTFYHDLCRRLRGTFYVGIHADADSTKRPRNVIKIGSKFSCQRLINCSFFLFHSFPSNVSVTTHARIPTKLLLSFTKSDAELMCRQKHADRCSLYQSHSSTHGTVMSARDGVFLTKHLALCVVQCAWKERVTIHGRSCLVCPHILSPEDLGRYWQSHMCMFCH